jgi:hypothetical protein
MHCLVYSFDSSYNFLILALGRFRVHVLSFGFQGHRLGAIRSVK